MFPSFAYALISLAIIPCFLAPALRMWSGVAALPHLGIRIRRLSGYNGSTSAGNRMPHRGTKRSFARDMPNDRFMPEADIRRWALFS